MRRDVSERTLALLRGQEDVRRHAYDDATGRRVHAPEGVLTIGIGINLDIGLDDYEVDMLERHRLEIEWARFCRDASTLNPPVVCSCLPVDAQVALASMAFNLGADGLLEFHKMLLAVGHGLWADAARECLSSKWASQVHAHRAGQVADLLRGCGAVR